jgi:hypothetical protein
MSLKFNLLALISIAQSTEISSKANVLSIGRSQEIQAQSGIYAMTWPGIALKTRFEGNNIGIQINDSRNSYNLYIDGVLNQKIAPVNSKQEIWIENLANKEHTALLVKATESSNYSGEIGPFLIKKGKWLSSPSPSKRQIEFIGDSWTAALGNMSDVRECSYEESQSKSDVNFGFASLTAQKYSADWQINAYSGMGINRNWNGNDSAVNFRTYYPRTLQFDSVNIYNNPQWNPQVYVIGLGINDFSTPINPGEKWTEESLNQAYKNEFIAFIQKLRSKSPKAQIIITREYLWPKDQVRPFVLEIVKTLRDQGDLNISSVEYTDLELKGCLWHPNQKDHQKMSNALILAIDSLPQLWK